MKQYTVLDEMTGKQITFEWEGAKPPGEKDMRDVFSQARKTPPIEPGNYTKTTTQNSWGGEDPYAGEQETQKTWLPESYGGVPRWGLENPALWGLRGAGLEVYDKMVQPSVEAGRRVSPFCVPCEEFKKLFKFVRRQILWISYVKPVVPVTDEQRLTPNCLTQRFGVTKGFIDQPKEVIRHLGVFRDTGHLQGD